MEITPACAEPAPLTGHFDKRAPGYLVLLRYHPTFFDETMMHIERDYTVHVRSRWPATNGFWAEISPDQVAQLRCDPAIKSIEYNAIIVLGANAG